MIAGVMVGSTLIHLHINSSEINLFNEMFASIYIYVFAVFARFLSIGIFIRYLRNLG
jgi:hypothetical protein